MAKRRYPRQSYQRVKFPLPSGFQESVVVELKYEAPVAPAQGKFVGSGEGVELADRLNEVLGQEEVADIRPSFTIKPAMVRASLNVSAALPAAATAGAI